MAAAQNSVNTRDMPRAQMSACNEVVTRDIEQQCTAVLCETLSFRDATASSLQSVCYLFKLKSKYIYCQYDTANSTTAVVTCSAA